MRLSPRGLRIFFTCTPGLMGVLRIGVHVHACLPREAGDFELLGVMAIPRSIQEHR